MKESARDADLGHPPLLNGLSDEPLRERCAPPAVRSLKCPLYESCFVGAGTEVGLELMGGLLPIVNHGTWSASEVEMVRGTCAVCCDALVSSTGPFSNNRVHCVQCALRDACGNNARVSPCECFTAESVQR